MPKVLSIHLVRTNAWRGQWPPDNFFKEVDDASEIELYQDPVNDRIWLYLVWPDGYKYFVDWDSWMLKNFLGDKYKHLFKKKLKVWDSKLYKKLLKDAKPHPIKK